MTPLQADIEARLASVEPEVEVLLAEVVRGEIVRLFIDHPQGVTLGMCERVTNHLAPLREAYAIEVSSPGPERPLSKPEHFRRYAGRRARLRTTQGEQRSYTGEILGADEDEVTLAAPEGMVRIPYADIRRSHLLGD